MSTAPGDSPFRVEAAVDAPDPGQFDAICDVVGIRRRGERRYLTWFGETVGAIDNPALVDRLAGIVYANAYVLGRPMPIDADPIHVPDASWYQLSVGAHLRAEWSGWSLGSDGRLRLAGMPSVEAPVELIQQQVDGDVRLPMPAVTLAALSGWLLVRHGDLRRFVRPVRLYANTHHRRIQDLLDPLTQTLLDHGEEHFAAKFLTTTCHGERTDSTVIYLHSEPRQHPPRSSSAWRSLLAAVVDLLAPAVLDQAVPLFTMRLAPGIAAAHGPDNGESHGQRWSRQVAQAVVAAHRDSRTVARLPTERSPWNAKGRPPLESIAPTPRHRAAKAANPDPPDIALDKLADSLHRSSIVAHHRATWLVRDRQSGRTKTTGADVYGGSAGALLALAQHIRLCNTRRHLPLLRATARAMHDRQHELPAHGFHSGRSGTAAVLAETAALLDDDELTSIAHAALAAARIAEPAGREWDQISGVSGTITALHAAGDLLNVDDEAAVQALSTQLVDQCEDDPRTGGIRWRARIDGRRPTLAGLAHGGSGAALALSLTSPSETATNLIVRTVRFEDESRSTDSGWVDARRPRPRGNATAWCHGAGGIGLASAAITLTRTVDLRNRALLAGDRTAAAVAPHPRHDGGLCHGSIGRALAAYTIARALGEPPPAGLLDYLDPTLADPGDEDFSLMTGQPGEVLARLAINGQTAPPVGFVLDPALSTAAATELPRSSGPSLLRISAPGVI